MSDKRDILEPSREHMRKLIANALHGPLANSITRTRWHIVFIQGEYQLLPESGKRINF